jgi:hypothetical protein
MKSQQLLNSESPGESATDSAEKKCIAPPAPAAKAAKVHSQEAQGEESKDKVVQIFKPSQNDVLFGRGKVSILHYSMKTTVLVFLLALKYNQPFQGHQGNMRLHKIVNLHKERYLSSRRYDKLAIADDIVRDIKSGRRGEPGRFMKRANGEEYWIEVGDDVAREKVSHALRGKPRKKTDEGGSGFLVGAPKRSTQLINHYNSLHDPGQRQRLVGSMLQQQLPTSSSTAGASLHHTMSQYHQALLPQLAGLRQTTMLRRPLTGPSTTRIGNLSSLLTSRAVPSHQLPANTLGRSNPFLLANMMGSSLNHSLALSSQREQDAALTRIYVREQAMARMLQQNATGGIDDSLPGNQRRTQPRFH